MKRRIMIQKKKCHKVLEETKNTIMSLKIQLEEAKRMEEVVRIQLKEKEENVKS
jgi:hypothetical protein